MINTVWSSDVHCCFMSQHWANFWLGSLFWIWCNQNKHINLCPFVFLTFIVNFKNKNKKPTTSHVGSSDQRECRVQWKMDRHLREAFSFWTNVSGPRSWFQLNNLDIYEPKQTTATDVGLYLALWYHIHQMTSGLWFNAIKYIIKLTSQKALAALTSRHQVDAIRIHCQTGDSIQVSHHCMDNFT